MSAQKYSSEDIDDSDSFPQSISSPRSTSVNLDLVDIDINQMPNDRLQGNQGDYESSPLIGQQLLKNLKFVENIAEDANEEVVVPGQSDR